MTLHIRPQASTTPAPSALLLTCHLMSQLALTKAPAPLTSLILEIRSVHVFNHNNNTQKNNNPSATSLIGCCYGDASPAVAAGWVTLTQSWLRETHCSISARGRGGSCCMRVCTQHHIVREVKASAKTAAAALLQACFIRGSKFSMKDVVGALPPPQKM